GILRLKKVRRKVWRVLRMPDGTEHLAAIRSDDRRRVPLQGVAERLIGGDEEPAINPLLDHWLPRRLGESVSVIGPVHAGWRAGFSRQIRRAGGRNEQNSILILRNLLDGKGNRRHRHVGDRIYALALDPFARDVGADVRLVLMIGRNNLDLL